MKKDPYLAREYSKYKNPIASREYILNLIKHKKRLHKTRLFQLLNLKEAEKNPLSYRLKAMLRDKQITLNDKDELMLFDANSVEIGKVIGHARGFGFVALEAGGKDLRLSKTQMQLAFHGETVAVRRLVNSLDARIVYVKERIKKIIGRIAVIEKDGTSYLEADDARIPHKILITNFSKKYKLYQMAVAEIVHYPTFKKVAKVKIISILGDYLAKGLEVETALLRYQIPKEFSEKTQKEAKQIPSQLNALDKKDRKDLTKLAFITIDGENSRDFDDAVYAQKIDEGWCLWVGIADVSHYVKPNTYLDKTAAERANSVYFPSRVIPMLPENISNGICSLNPLVERLCLTCEMIISANGEVSSYKFYTAVMRSNARMTYQEVENILTGKHIHKNKAIYNNILALSTLHKKLLAIRIKRGALIFERTTNKLILNDNDKIKSIIKNRPLRSEQIIEECMLLANESTAQFLDKHKQAFLYRVHAKPKVEKLEDIARLLNSLGVSVIKNRLTDTKHLMGILKKAKIKFDENIIQNIILRTMQTAIYSTKNSGHFGLALNEYTHFTSPIRRYPDLLIHRLIKNVLHLKKQKRDQNQPREEKKSVARKTCPARLIPRKKCRGSQPRCGKMVKV